MNIRRLFILFSKNLSLLLVGVLACLLTTKTYAQSKTVSVGVYDSAPSIFLSEQGRAAGIMGDLLQAIADAEGWDLQAVQCDWQTCLDLLQTSQIDLLPNVDFTPERAKLYGFHTVPALHNWSQIYANQDTSIQSFFDLEGKQIAVLTGSMQYQFIESLLTNFGIPATLVGVGKPEDGFTMVANGQADAVVSSYYYGAAYAGSSNVVATSIMFEPTRTFYVAKRFKNRHLLNAIDTHLTQWQSNSSSIYYTILQQWGKPTPRMEIPVIFWWAVAALVFLLLLALSVAALLKSQVARQTQHIKAREIWLNTVLDSVDAFIFFKDSNFRYKYCNSKSYEFLGLQPNELLGRTDHELFHYSDMLPSIKDSDQRVISELIRVVTEDEVASLSEENALRTLVTVKQPMFNQYGKLEGICGITTDTTALKAARQKVHELAYYDSLTSLPNRQLLFNKLELAMESAQNGHFISALLFIDLDDFKKLNDARGHLTGDILLREVGQRLRKVTRQYDTVARIGGDEFVILLTRLGLDHKTATEKAVKVAGKVCHSLALSFDIDGQPFWSGASIGVTLIHQNQQSIEDVLREADTAMYQSKAAGRNCVTLYETSMQQKIEDRLSLENDINQAIDQELFEMYAQPQFNHYHEVVGAELLIRWDHPARGMVPPSVFIPIAEQTGTIIRLGEWVLRQACLALTQPSLKDSTISLSINVSPNQFKQHNFVAMVKRVLTETKAPANRLVLEITEGVLIENMKEVQVRMDELSAIGIRFSIDDFGTGYSNLSTLNQLSLYELKIDQSLTFGISTDPNSAVIIRLILAMARQLGLSVIAEGVETQDQADFLIDNGCDSLQGYFYMRPLPLNQWLQQIDMTCNQ